MHAHAETLRGVRSDASEGGAEWQTGSHAANWQPWTLEQDRNIRAMAKEIRTVRG
ncbi:hypothetical protein [Streptomyces lancefieldiae]|uniref:Uncharacterized protein n=1 Tax=Streptomyces lancefieldiae TaxID=3075520 RepID=A0ABU3AGL6_9ACTN|nr:hypothetical protein [Streptomyces sp. DSM 40712]MDT0609063.1 hypothetical protein [Streptomyces sp. DSM 40712]